MPTRRSATVIIESTGVPPCRCGATRVSVFRDGLETLLDNMGCELGLELVAGPLCPRCDASEIESATNRARSRPGRSEP